MIVSTTNINIDGNRIQLLLSSWIYKGFGLISVNINEDGYELIAADSHANGVMAMGDNLDQAIRNLVYEVETMTASDYQSSKDQVNEAMLTQVA